MHERSTHRSKKVGTGIQRILSSLLLLDEDFEGITITEVDVSPNLRYTKVFFVCPPNRNIEDVMLLFEKKLTKLQKNLAEQINLKYATTLQFVFDKAFEHAEKISHILNEIKS